MNFRFSTATVVGAVCLILIMVPTRASAASSAGPQALSHGASAPPEIDLSFEELAVVASDLTPGGDAVIFSVARVPRGYLSQVVRFRGVELVDPFGEARYMPETDDGTVPLKSVWAVVDLETGAYGIGAPPRFKLRQVAFPGRGFEVGAPGLVNRLHHRFRYVDMLLVRPGVGAWMLRAVNQGEHDRGGGGDGRPTTAVEDMQPLGAGPPPPDRFADGDVLVVIDPRTLAFYAARLIGPPTGSGGAP